MSVNLKKSFCNVKTGFGRKFFPTRLNGQDFVLNSLKVAFRKNPNRLTQHKNPEALKSLDNDG